MNVIEMKSGDQVNTFCLSDNEKYLFTADRLN